MPRVRFRLPLEIEVTPEQLDAGRAVGDVVLRARESGIAGAIFDAVKKTGDAVRAAKKNRR